MWELEIVTTDGSRTLTVQPNGTMVYTPFPEVERTVPASGPATDRNHYYLAGQLIAVRVKTVGQTGAFYYFYTDRQGSVHALRQADGTWVNGNYARYDAYGGYRTTPAATVNPGISDRGYTGHRMNNTGNDLGLIYMNARYYMPEVGRFISADTIVPEPANPQTYNRYSYALNSPVNFTDPTGHCTSNYEAGSQDMVTCLSAWNSVANYLYGAAFGSGGSGNFPNETVSDWLANADIGTLENLMESYGIGYGYTYTSPQGYSVPALRDGEDLGSQESKAELCQYWKECYYPVTDYTTIFVSYYIGGKIIRDDFGNWYLNAHFSSMPSVGLMRGDINIPSSIYYKDIADLAVDQRELIVQSALQGWGGGANVSMGLGLGIGSNPSNDIFYEGGVSLPGFAGEFGYTWLIFDK